MYFLSSQPTHFPLLLEECHIPLCINLMKTNVGVYGHKPEDNWAQLSRQKVQFLTLEYGIRVDEISSIANTPTRVIVKRRKIVRPYNFMSFSFEAMGSAEQLVWMGIVQITVLGFTPTRSPEHSFLIKFMSCCYL